MNRDRCCKCRCDFCEPGDILDEILEAIRGVEEGIKDIVCGLEDICCCRIQEGIRGIERGLCKVDKCLDKVIDGLRDVEFECDYRSNMNIKEGICDLKDGIRGVQEGLCQLKNCCLCEGLESVQCGLHDLQEGLCNLVRGVDDLSDERDRRRKSKCC
ncbi:MAG: hypothetical protein WCX60_06560 [Anaerovoracaceae bacterium]